LPYRALYIIVLCLSLSKLGPAQTSERLSNEALVVFTNKYITADKERVLGNYQEAFKLYAECLSLDPKNDGVHYSLGRLFLTQNQLDQAEHNFKLASRLDPNNKYYLIELIDVLSAQQKYKEADKEFKRLRSLEPRNPEYVYNHASMLLYAQKVKKALNIFDEFEQLSGPSPEVALIKFQYLVGAGKYGDAESTMLKAIDLFPTEMRFYSNLADLYKAENSLKKALGIYSQAMSVEPSNPYIQLSLAEYFEKTNQTDSAQFYLERAFGNPRLDIDTKVSLLLSMYPQAELNKETRANTIRLCEQLLTAHPNEAKSHSVYGDFLYLDGQRENARTSYYKTLEFDQSRFAIWNQILLLDSELNDEKAMLIDSEKALELFPTQPSIYLFNGIANNQLKNHKAAVKSLKTGSQMVVGNYFLSAQLLASLGDAYHEIGQTKSSDSAYTGSLRYDSTNLYVLNNFAYYLSLRKEDLQKAKRMSFKTVEAAPTNASYLDTYGWILFQLGLFSEASNYLEKALDSGGDKSPEVLEHYGDTMFRLNNQATAIVYWEKALNLGSDSEGLQEKINTKNLAE
jgi:tetratricopeptide (TPR) repeat protein